MKENKETDNGKPIDQRKNDQGRLNKFTSAIAGYLNKKINPISTYKKRVGFIAFGLLTCIACLLIVIQSFRNVTATPVLRVDPITKPIDIFPEHTLSEQQSEQELIRQYNRMMKFKQLIDQLSAASNEAAIDSLMNANPGLRDSLNALLKEHYPN